MENLIYAARLYSVPVKQAKKDVVQILEALGISATRVNQPVEKMSRGMQQKVAIARALLTSPVVLLLDEPTTGLDPRSKKDVQRFIRDLREQHDATILLTSHDMDEADALCDRLAILDGGRIVVEGTPQQLKDDYALRHELDSTPELEDVFMEFTGRSLDEDFESDDGGSE
jgi:ABC-2 type transport system ATP-binding protein